MLELINLLECDKDKYSILFNGMTTFIELLTLLTIIVGGAFALFKYHSLAKLKRADYAINLAEKLRTDESLIEAYKKIDYGNKNGGWYNSEFHNSGKTEQEIDRLFAYFSYVLYLRKERVISKKEFAFLEHNIDRLLKSNQSKDYLYNLYHFSDLQGIQKPFNNLIEYAKEKMFIDKLFFCNDSWMKNQSIYHNYIGFSISHKSKPSSLIEVTYLKGSDAVVDMYSGENKVLNSCKAFVGKNGIDKECEGDKKTPTGFFGIQMVFGTNLQSANICSSIICKEIGDNDYWSNGPDNYNQWVTCNDSNKIQGEHLSEYKNKAYKYAIVLDYNKEGVWGKGSAIFLHCFGDKNYTAGCISVAEKDMEIILMNLTKDTKIWIHGSFEK